MGEANIKFAQGDHQKAISICMDIIKMGKDTLAALSCFKDTSVTHHKHNFLHIKQLYLFVVPVYQNSVFMSCFIFDSQGFTPKEKKGDCKPLASEDIFCLADLKLDPCIICFC